MCAAVLSRVAGPQKMRVCRGTDPAARAAVTGFVQGPPESQAVQYNITVEQVLAVQQYLRGLARAVVAPLFQADVLGPSLGPDSGGLVVSRTVGQWITGESSAVWHAACVHITSIRHITDSQPETLHTADRTHT